jgi:IclR family transcriptional regulator, KDG regulon repressor
VRRGAQTVHRAIDILETFSTDRPTLSLGEVSDTLGLTVPTTHRLLKALQSKEMVVWDPSSRRYSLGSGVMRLASVVVHRDDLHTIVQPGLERLRVETSETISLHRLVGSSRVCLIELTSPHPIRMASGVGRSYPLFAGAAGKAILAWLPVETVNRLIAEAVDERKLSAVAAKKLSGELAGIRQSGIAVSRGETVPGAAAVAASIFNSSGVIIAAINITGPADRFSEARVRQAVKPLVTVATEVMRQLGRPAGRPFDGSARAS